jgi:two-component system, NtrC family, sensor histidine kinase PilS
LTTSTPPLESAEVREAVYPGGPELPPAPRRTLQRLALPGPRALLSAILVVRLVLIAMALGRALSPAPGPADRALATSITALAAAALAATVWLFWLLRRSAETPGPNSLLLQALVDVLVVTSLVTFTTEAVAALYIALVTVYALLLPVGRGLVVVALAVGSYVIATLMSSMPPDAAFWPQVGVIAFIGALIAVLGNRLAGASQAHHVLAAALAQAQREAHEILGNIQSGVITVDGDGRLGYLNTRGREILGGAPFLLGQPVLEILRARSRELHDAIVRGITDGSRVSRGEAAVRRADGTLFPVGLSTTTFHRPGTGRRLVTAIFTDISDLKRLQEFRLRAERLEAVAALSASLAHEIRNPLAAIRSAVEQLAHRVGDDEDEQTLARLVMRESERLNRLLSEFLDFSRVRAGEFVRLDLTELVRDTLRIAQEHPSTRGVQMTVEGDETPIDADKDLMHRIVSNLVLNAAQALDGRGTVTVSVARVAVGDRPPGSLERSIRLMVRDDGPGIPEAVRERLFEPFVTGRQGGTGLGLAIVQRAVAAHRGVILVDSSPRHGTTFTIYLPATWNRESGA